MYFILPESVTHPYTPTHTHTHTHSHTDRHIYRDTHRQTHNKPERKRHKHNTRTHSHTQKLEDRQKHRNILRHISSENQTETTLKDIETDTYIKRHRVDSERHTDRHRQRETSTIVYVLSNEKTWYCCLTNQRHVIVLLE